MMSPGVESPSNNLGIEARIASAIELPQMTLVETSKRFTFSIFVFVFLVLLFKDNIF